MQQKGGKGLMIGQSLGFPNNGTKSLHGGTPPENKTTGHNGRFLDKLKNGHSP
jgi:hypothetical protein